MLMESTRTRVNVHLHSPDLTAIKMLTNALLGPASARMEPLVRILTEVTLASALMDGLDRIVLKTSTIALELLVLMGLPVTIVLDPSSVNALQVILILKILKK